MFYTWIPIPMDATRSLQVYLNLRFECSQSYFNNNEKHSHPNSISKWIQKKAMMNDKDALSRFVSEELMHQVWK